MFVLEKTMATHSSTLAWKIPWTEEPGRLQYMGLLRVGHDWATSLSLFTFIHWRRQWQSTPVLLPGKFHGRGSLVGCYLWGRTESDMTEVTEQQQQQNVCLVIIWHLTRPKVSLWEGYWSEFIFLTMLVALIKVFMVIKNLSVGIPIDF